MSKEHIITTNDVLATVMAAEIHIASTVSGRGKKRLSFKFNKGYVLTVNDKVIAETSDASEAARLYNEAQE